jgi:hypothetical protein
MAPQVLPDSTQCYMATQLWLDRIQYNTHINGPTIIARLCGVLYGPTSMARSVNGGYTSKTDLKSCRIVRSFTELYGLKIPSSLLTGIYEPTIMAR